MSFDQTKRLHDVTAVAINTTRPSQCWRDWTETDVAIESAGVTLVKGDLSGIVKAIQLSRATMRNIRQNLFFAFIYNALGIPVAAGLLVPFFGTSALLSPMIAAAAMSFSSVSVIANALRLPTATIRRQ